MKKTLRKSMLFVLAAMMVMMLGAFSASAATRKITVKGQKFTTKTAVAKTKATTVKVGSYFVTLGSSKEHGGYMKFTAPKTKTYAFKISNPTVIKPSYTGAGAYGHGYLQLPRANRPDSIGMSQFSTNGGKTTSYSLCTKTYYDPVSTIKTSTYLPSRTAKIKLKKGQTVYIYAWFTSKCYMNLAIQ